MNSVPDGAALAIATKPISIAEIISKNKEYKLDKY